MKYTLPTSRGFTLIELMIVMIVIAMLATLALVGLGTMQKKARDTQRIATMAGVRTGLECAYGTGAYPLTAAWSWATVKTVLGASCFGTDTIADPGGANIPANGTVVAGGATYAYVGTATTYTLTLTGESGVVKTWTNPQ